MKTKLTITFLFFYFFIFQSSIAQVAINTTGNAPVASSMLDITSSTSGLLIPRMSLAQKTAIAAPATGLLVYQTDGQNGFWYYNGTTWIRLFGGNAWDILGNTGTSSATNFLGTTDAQDLQFRTNNINKMLIKSSLYPTVGIGTSFPVTNLDGAAAILHLHDGGSAIPSQLILSTHSTTVGAKTGNLIFSATQVTNDRRTGSIESNLIAYAGGNASGDLRFFTNNVNSYTEKMRIMPNGSIGIGTTSPAVNSILDLTSTTSGMLTPRMTLAQKTAIIGPATGLLVYQTDGLAGFWYFNGTIWVRLYSGSASAWDLLGNAGTVAATNFIGTTDAVDFVIRTNNSENARITSGGLVGIGINAPTHKLTIQSGTISTIRLIGPGGFGSTARLNFGDGNYVYFEEDADDYLTIYGANRIALMGGNVGIGLANPAYDLEIDGSFGFGDGTAGSYRSRTETRNDAGQMATQSGFFQTSAPAPATSWPTGAGSWWHLIDCRHSNNGNNYALQLAGGFFDQELYYRKTNNNASQAWKLILATSTAGNAGQALISQGAGLEPTWSGVITPSQIYSVESTSSVTLNGTWQIIPGESLTINGLNAGDRVLINYSGNALMTTSDHADVSTAAFSNGVMLAIGGYSRFSLDYSGTNWIGWQNFSSVARYTIPANGNYTFDVRAYMSGSGTISVGGNSTQATEGVLIIYVLKN